MSAPNLSAADLGGSWTNRRWLYALGLVAFGIALFLALANLPPRPNPFRWELLAVVLVALAPMTVILGGMEYAATARVLGIRVGFVEAQTVSVLSSAANLLPLPGAYLVRARALIDAGSTTSRSVASPLAVGVAWVGTAGVVAGAWSVASEPDAFGLVVLGAGLVALVAALYAFRVLLGEWNLPLIGGVLGVELATVLVSAARYQLVLVASGFEADFSQGLVLALSSVLASAVGFIPGGLGLREALAAFFAPLASLPAAAGAIAAIINRVIGLVALMALAGALLLFRKPQDGERSVP